MKSVSLRILLNNARSLIRCQDRVITSLESPLKCPIQCWFLVSRGVGRLVARKVNINQEWEGLEGYKMGNCTPRSQR